MVGRTTQQKHQNRRKDEATGLEIQLTAAESKCRRGFKVDEMDY